MRSIGYISEFRTESASSRLACLLRGVVASFRRNVLRCIGLVLTAASLAACAQSSMVSGRAGLAAPSRQAAREPRHEIRSVAHTPMSVVRVREPERSSVVAALGGSRGLASFYTEGHETASGERFDTHELTAAHPTLPFGTRLQVTNVATGRSVMVRVNDRGPFVKGRVVDVSYSAAQALGMVHAGVANVKVDIVQ
jgi:rare lipoprotein A